MIEKSFERLRAYQMSRRERMASALLKMTMSGIKDIHNYGAEARASRRGYSRLESNR